MVRPLLLNEVKVNIIIDDIRLKTNLTFDKTIRFTEKLFFYMILGFIQPHLGEIGDIPGFVQLIPGTYQSDKTIINTEIDKVRSKCVCIDGIIANGIREPILYSFALSSPPGHKIHKEPRLKLFVKIKKSVLSYIAFYLEDEDHKVVDFIRELISFTCQLNET